MNSVPATFGDLADQVAHDLTAKNKRQIAPSCVFEQIALFWLGGRRWRRRFTGRRFIKSSSNRSQAISKIPGADASELQCATCDQRDNRDNSVCRHENTRWCDLSLV